MGVESNPAFPPLPGVYAPPLGIQWHHPRPTSVRRRWLVCSYRWLCSGDSMSRICPWIWRSETACKISYCVICKWSKWTNLSCTAVPTSMWSPLPVVPLPLLLTPDSSTRTKLSGNIPVTPEAFRVPCHQPPGICLIRWIMAPFWRSSSSGSLAAYSYSTIAQTERKKMGKWLVF